MGGYIHLALCIKDRMSSRNTKSTRYPEDPKKVAMRSQSTIKKISTSSNVKSLKQSSQQGIPSGSNIPKPPPKRVNQGKSVRFDQSLIDSSVKKIQTKSIYGESDRREEIAPEGGTRKTIRKIKDHIDCLNDFDPTKVVISTMSAEYITTISVVEVDKPNEDPKVSGGVNDSVMGTTNGDSCCSKCLQVFCNGHIGRINLAVPVINKLFFREIVAIMNSVCQNCGKLLRDFDHVADKNPNIRSLSGWRRLSLYAKTCKTAVCSDSKCVEYAVKNPYIKEPINSRASKDINHFVRDGQPIDSKTIYETLSRISDKDAEVLGFNRETKPRDLLFTVLPVIPPIARPPVYAGGTIKQDQLTHYYARIVVDNQKVRDAPGKNTSEQNALYDSVTNLINGSKKKRVEYGDSIGILQRINSKKGLFRKSIQGKRVNYSGRAVLSPGITIEFGEIGVPEAMARHFHMPVVVKADNYQFLLELLMAGKIVTHTPKEGDKAGLKTPVDPGDQITLKIGDEVERMAVDGDMCVFNRQPTIHHGSLLGYTIRVMKEGNTIRLHPSSTTSHNADFDGDAAMILYPRDPQAIEEVRYLIHTIQNLIDDKHGKPLAGIIMDGITSAFLMTNENEIIHPLIFMSAIESMKTPIDIEELQERAVKYGLHPWSGRTLFSALLPEDFTYNNAGIVIYNGILINGRVKSGAIDTSSRSLVQELWKFYNEHRAADFLTDATRVLLFWLNNYGFSIGSADIDFGNTEEIAKMKRQFLDDINAQIRELGKIPQNKFEQEKHEEKVMSIVDRALVFGKEIAVKKMKEGVAEIYGRQNAIGIMAKDIGAGAKADLFNVAMIGGSVGQQYYAGERPAPVLSGSGLYQPRPKIELTEMERKIFLERELSNIEGLKLYTDIDTLVKLTESLDKYGMEELLVEMKKEEITKKKINEIKKKNLGGNRVGNWGRFIATMPLRPKDVEAPAEERGYCIHSFSDGMTPSESFAQAWGTRGDLINTNMMTATVGDAQRRLTKALENITIHDDGTVRALTGPIYQFSWGNDGLESMFMVQADTAHHGRVQVFCDLESIVERANAKVGLIRKDYTKFIDSNKQNADKYEANFKKELDRPKDQVETGRVYRTKLVECEEPEMPNKSKKTANPSRRYGVPQIIKSFTQVEQLDEGNYLTTPQNVEDLPPKAQENIKLIRPSQAFERKQGQKTSFYNNDIETEEY